MLAQNIREKFLKYYPDEDLKKWFDPLVLSYSKPGSGSAQSSPLDLTVRFPHKLFAEWFEHKHRAKFEQGLVYCLGKQPGITYSCPGVAKLKFVPKAAPKPEDSAEAEIERDQTFKNFIFNRKNQFPVAAALNFTQGQTYGVLILFGPSGCGKSHLIRSMHNEAKQIVPEKTIFISNLSDLETFFTNALKNSQSPLSYLGNFRYILIDDLDMAAAQPFLQEQLVTLMEYAQSGKLSVAITMQQRPGALTLMSEKLRSLLEAALVIELKKPDLDVRRQYVDHFANKLNLQLKKDDALALARMYSGFRQIYGALLKVSSFKVLSPQAAEAKLADILQTSLSDDKKRLSPDHIINAVSELFRIDTHEITGKKRRQDIVQARHIAMYLCRELLGAQFGHIGACFSDRDHSSVLYSVNKISSMIKSDKDTHKLVTEVKNIIMK